MLPEKFRKLTAITLLAKWREENCLIERLLKIDRQFDEGEKFFELHSHKYKLKEVRRVLLENLTKDEELDFLTLALHIDDKDEEGDLV